MRERKSRAPNDLLDTARGILAGVGLGCIVWALVIFLLLR